MVLGTCKLCLSPGVRLFRSHFIPAAAYGALQASTGTPPVVLKQKVTIQKNEQATAHILCEVCEDRFNKHGESWVMKYCRKPEGGFRLKELIESTAPFVGSKVSIYSAASIPEIDVSQLVYFVTSIMWRGSVHVWRSGKERMETPSLGKKYEEILRRYLLGETDFPQSAAVWLSLIPAPELSNGITPPYGGKFTRVGQFWEYKFQFLGIAYMFFLGKEIDPTIRRACFYRSPERIVFMGDETNEMILRDVGMLIAKSKVVGRFKDIG